MSHKQWESKLQEAILNICETFFRLLTSYFVFPNPSWSFCCCFATTPFSIVLIQSGEDRPPFGPPLLKFQNLQLNECFSNARPTRGGFHIAGRTAQRVAPNFWEYILWHKRSAQGAKVGHKGAKQLMKSGKVWIYSKNTLGLRLPSLF